MGALVKAVQATEPDPARRVRSVTSHIMAPALVGPHTIVVEPLRIGSSVSTWRATLADATGAPIADLVAVAGAPRAFAASVPGSWGVAVPPATPSPDEVPRVPGGPPFPVFTRHLDMRPVSGLPLSGGPAESVGWLGYDVATRPSAAALLALVDGWYPASLPLLETLPPIGTVSFTAALLVDPDTVRADDVVLHHSFLTSASDGYTSEHRRLWSADGLLLVDNVQTIVVGS